ncbi:MAG: S1C family serine protease [Actinomycetota bacterium]
MIPLLRRGVVAAAVVLLSTSCAADDVIGDAAEAVTGVRASGCGLTDQVGNGVFVSNGDRTVIVTSAHTVAGASTITVEHGLQRADVDVLAIDPKIDLAVLSAPSWARPGRRLSSPTAEQRGRLAIWDPDGPVEVTDTTITRLLQVTIEDIYVQGSHERQAFELDASIVRGDSGAPVVADDGSIVGVVYARSRDRDGVAFAVSSDEIRTVVAAATTDPVDPGRCP